MSKPPKQTDDPTQTPEPGGGQPIPAGRIRGQLETILASATFRGTSRTRSILRFVVGLTLEGKESEIKGMTIAMQVLGRTSHFDASKDPIVSIEARKLRQALEAYYLGEGRADPIEIQIPRGRYVPEFRWRSNEISLFEKVNSRTGSWRPSLRVHPTANDTGDPACESLCRGIDSEIVIGLTRFRTIAVRIAESGEPDSESPTGILTAGLRKVGKYFKLGVILKDYKSGNCVWAEHFSEPVEADDVADRCARRVVANVGGEHGAVNLHLVPAMRTPPPFSDPTTYEAMIAYYQFDHQRSHANLCEILPLLHHAVANDPASGLLKAMLGQIKISTYAQSFSDDRGCLDEGMELATAAVRLEPDDQFCLETQAWALFLLGHLDLALVHLERAYLLNPNAPYRVAVIGWDMMLCGAWERGREILEGALSLNPGNPAWLWFAFCFDEFRRGNYEAALQQASRPDLPKLIWPPLMRAAAFGQIGQLREGAEACAELLANRPEFASCGKSMIGRLIKHRELFDDIVSGLAKSGLAVS